MIGWLRGMDMKCVTGSLSRLDHITISNLLFASARHERVSPSITAAKQASYRLWLHCTRQGRRKAFGGGAAKQCAVCAAWSRGIAR